MNIITADVEGSARFYAELFGLEPRDGPPPLTHANARWMYDAAGRAVLHINSLDCPRTYDREVRPGPTGALHHVALSCRGYRGSAGAARKTAAWNTSSTRSPRWACRQIFVLDPNGVLLELNFFGG